MSTSIDTAFVQQFNGNVELLSQQKVSRLSGKVRMETQRGDTEFFEQLNATETTTATTRHDDTQYVNQQHDRRAVTLQTERWADLIDKKDRVQMLIDPTSPYAANAAAAMNRAYDVAIMTAALGSAKTGKSGSTLTALPTAQKIAAGGAKLTLAKLIQAQEIFDAGDVDPDENKYITVTQASLNALFNDTKVTSSDFNTVKALAQGEINSYMGFQFVRVSPSLFLRTGTDYRLVAWAESGLLFSKGEGGMTSRIDELPNKNYSTQVFLEDTFGATRMEEVKVVEIASIA